MALKSEDVLSIVNQLVGHVIENHDCEAEVDIEPDRINVRFSPWKPYELKCPYGKDKDEN